jgi:hypothetical protein
VIHKGGNSGEILTTLEAKKTRVSKIVDLKHGTRIDGFSCLRHLYTQAAQVGLHVTDNKLCPLYIIPLYICTYYAIPDCLFFSAG